MDKNENTYCDRCGSSKATSVMVRHLTAKRGTRKMLCEGCIEQSTYAYNIKRLAMAGQSTAEAVAAMHQICTHAVNSDCPHYS